jgi:hypothetical protein
VPTQQTPQLPELIALLACSDLSGSMIIRHGYRRARVVGDDVTDGPFPYTSGDEFDQLQHRLAAAVGDRVDNHETYEVWISPDQKIYLWFHDWKVAVGTDIRPY